MHGLPPYPEEWRDKQKRYNSREEACKKILRGELLFAALLACITILLIFLLTPQGQELLSIIRDFFPNFFVFK